VLRVNLIFQGGGVKGIAFAGALDAVENTPHLRGKVKVEGVGGVSVGAITAALYAAGYTAQELKDELEKTSVASLLPGGSPTPLGAVWRLWRHKGIYSTSRIYSWIERLLDQKGVRTFGDLKRPCRILAANITDRVYRIFSEKEPGEHVASAVLRSLSIPLYFTPYVDGQRLFVDGGLLSNYPLWLFQDSPLPTLGLKLLAPAWRGATPASGFVDYLISLLRTMLEAHDEVGRGVPPDLGEIVIDANFVEGTNFGIEDRDQQLLFARGRDAVASFDWSRVRGPAPIAFRDSQAALILEQTAAAIQKVIDRTDTTPKVRSYDYYHQIYVIEDGGDGIEEVKFRLRNDGTDPITLVRRIFEYDYEVPVSFRDLAIDVTHQPPFEVVTLPLKNTSLSKWYALWFIPPISPGEAREITIRLRTPQAFRRFARGERDEVGFEVEHENGIREASLTIRVSKRIGQVNVIDELGKTKKKRSEVHLAGPGEDYHTCVWEFDPQGPGTSPLTFTAVIVGG